MSRSILIAFILTCSIVVAGHQPAWAQAAKGPRKEWSDAEIDAAKGKVASEYDRFTQSTVFGPAKSEQTGGNDVLGLSGDVYLNLCARVLADSVGPRYYLRAVYSGHGWAFLTGTVRLIIDDGDPVTIEGPSSDGERNVGYCGGALGCQVTEGTRIPVTAEFARRLAGAHKVEFRLVGSKGSLERWWKKVHFAHARALLEQME